MAVTKAEIEQKKKLAYTLFTDNGFDQKVISSITGISERSISKWKQEGDWETDREESRMGFDPVRKRLRKSYDRTLDIIEARPFPENVPTSKETDILNKLADTVKKLQTELSFSSKSETGKQFVNHIQRVYGQEKAIEVVNLWHEFLMTSA